MIRFLVAAHSIGVCDVIVIVVFLGKNWINKNSDISLVV